MIKSPTFREKIIEAYKKNAVIIDADGREYHFHNGYEYVEIGGLKWATKNVGAKDEFDSGFYFQWGDTKGYTAEDMRNGKKRFDFTDYPHRINGGLAKYNREDGKVVLDLEDDAARAHMGGSWRMPTKEEFEQFLELVDTKWVDNYKGSGTNGLVCTDKTDKTKVLFFPAAGMLSNGNSVWGGFRGHYWARSCGISAAFGRAMCFKPIYIDTISNLYCYFGRSVRGVVE